MISPDRIDAMRNAIIAGDLNKVRILLKAGVPATSGDVTPFVCLAAMHCREDIFDLLIANGAPMDTPRLLETAVGGAGGRHQPSFSIVKKVLSRTIHDLETLDNCLRFACVSGSVEVVRLLLERGANPNAQHPKYKFFPLSNAVERGHLEIVRELLNHGANTTMEVWEFKENALTGNTSPLVDVAIQNGYTEIAKLLG